MGQADAVPMPHVEGALAVYAILPPTIIPWTVSGVEAPAQVAGKASLTTQAAVAAGNRELAVFLELPFPLWAWLLRIAAR